MYRRRLRSFPTRRSSDLAVFDVRLLHRRGIAELRPPRLLVRQARRDVFVRKTAHAAGEHDGFHARSEEHTAELQSHSDLVCRLLVEKKKTTCKVVCTESR